MPAHHGLADLLGIQVGKIIFNRTKNAAVINSSDWATIFNDSTLSEVGVGKIFAGNSDRNLNSEDARRILAQAKARREVLFNDYFHYRSYLHDIRPTGHLETKKIWTRHHGHLGRQLREGLDEHEKYDEKGHNNWRIEWKLNFEPDVSFDVIMRGLFERNWKITAILNKWGNKAIKRIEGKEKPGKSTMVLWHQ